MDFPDNEIYLVMMTSKMTSKFRKQAAIGEAVTTRTAVKPFPNTVQLSKSDITETYE